MLEAVSPGHFLLKTRVKAGGTRERSEYCHHYGKDREGKLCSRTMKKQVGMKSSIKKDEKKRAYGLYTVGLPPVAEETAKDEPRTTIADEEDNEFPDQLTNERKDYFNKYDKDRTISWLGIQERS
jgi:hypothetical protein